eukprot:1127476-Amphidinium_carterae.2
MIKNENVDARRSVTSVCFAKFVFQCHDRHWPTNCFGLDRHDNAIVPTVRLVVSLNFAHVLILQCVILVPNGSHDASTAKSS